MKECTTKLGGARECRAAVSAARIGDSLAVEHDAGGLAFFSTTGELLGRLTPKHQVSGQVAAGERVIFCNINSITSPSDSYPHGAINVRVVTGTEGETFEMPPVYSRTYPVGIAGETHFQPAIRHCRVNDPIVIWREQGNPHDPQALVAKTMAGETIGYIPRESWLRDAVYREERGLTATILDLRQTPAAIAVVLDVTLGGASVDAVPYAALGAPATITQQFTIDTATDDAVPALAEALAPRRSWLARLFGLA